MFRRLMEKYQTIGGVETKRLLLTVSKVVVLYVSIFLLVNYDFKFSFLQNSEDFLQTLISTFISGGAIAAITAILLVFQMSIQGEHERKKEIFENIPLLLIYC